MTETGILKHMELRRIYKRDTTGRPRYWYAEVDGGQWRSVSGLLDDGAAVVPSGWVRCVPRSKKTAEDQALFEAEAATKKRLDRGYHDSLDRIDDPHVFKPMLAHKFQDVGVPNTNLVFVQPKLDGIRCIATAAGLFSRSGKRIVSCPHIESALADRFALDTDLILDGELYNHDLRFDFERITSLVKQTKPTADDWARSAELVQYHVFDAPSVDGTFVARSVYVSSMFGTTGPVRVVSTEVVAADVLSARDTEIRALLADFIAIGYEGVMVRGDAPYENKRSKSLLKFKEFEDGEFELIGVESGKGNWDGLAKRAFIRLENGAEQQSGMRGSMEFARSLGDDGWKRYDRVTVRYQGRTADGKLRFPVVVAFHERGESRL